MQRKKKVETYDDESFGVSPQHLASQGRADAGKAPLYSALSGVPAVHQSAASGEILCEHECLLVTACTFFSRCHTNPS